MNRRDFIKTSAIASTLATTSFSSGGGDRKRIPVIDITDLYHPPQDPGDNFDLLTAYALPEIDLKAVILDVTEDYLHKGPEGQHPLFRDDSGTRDPGVIPVQQLNWLFDRNVPFGIGPFKRLKAPDDKALEAPRFQQSGIELLLEILQDSTDRVEILSFGSTRILAAAYNRDPGLLRKKASRIHIAAGASSPDYLEWNVMLDPQAMVCLLRSDLPLAIYPCATSQGPVDCGKNNTFWLLENLEFIRHMDPPLQRYLVYAFERSMRSDFLRVLEEELPADTLNRICQRRHNVWETALWAQVARRKLVRKEEGGWQFVPENEVGPHDRVNEERLLPCIVEVHEDGRFAFEKTTGPANFLIYERTDPQENEQALREALPSLYRSFRVSG
jgi:hypothetical protein